MCDVIICPWCKDEKNDDNPIAIEGIMFCNKCKEYFEWNRIIEVTFITRKIKYCDGKNKP